MQKASRLKKELKQLTESPSRGISCWVVDDKTDQLEASILGQDGTPYAGGTFKLSLTIPDRYPFEPPQARFTTPVYHPNIDTAGRICLDILKMPPKGAWKPSHNISTLLMSIHLLLGDPNPDDPLMADISQEFKSNRPLFNEKAKQWTTKYAMDKQNSPAAINDKKHVNREQGSTSLEREKNKRPASDQEISTEDKKFKPG